MPVTAPIVVDSTADREFQAAVREQYPKSYEWENRYVDHEATRIGRLFAAGVCPVAGKDVLEFGCNIGATSIVLAHNRARVVAADISRGSLQLAALNAQRYGVAAGIRFEHLSAGRPLPFPDASFDVVTCNSVLEYVAHDQLAATQRELDRVLKPGGLLLVFGTSNRMWPFEAHYRRWLINYIPRAFDPWLRRPIQRGVSPWTLRWGFGKGYRDVLAADAIDYIELKRRMGLTGWPLAVLRAVAALSPVSVGLLFPFATVLLRKPVESVATPRA